MVLGDFNAHHPIWFSRTGDNRAAANVRHSIRRSTVRSCELRHAHPPPLPWSALIARYLLHDVTGSTLTTLLDLTLSSHAPPPPRKVRSCTNFWKADWEGFTAEAGRIFSETPLPTSCSVGEKVFRRHYIPCGYVRDYCVPLIEVVRPLYLRERPSPHGRSSGPCHPAARPGHPAAPTPGSARPVETPPGVSTGLVTPVSW